MASTCVTARLSSIDRGSNAKNPGTGCSASNSIARAVIGWSGPNDLVAYRRTGEFNESTLPSGFSRDHSTKRGVWARIHVVSNALKYHVGTPIHRRLLVEAPATAIIVPEVPHRVETIGPVRFFVEFWRLSQTARSRLQSSRPEAPTPD